LVHVQTSLYRRDSPTGAAHYAFDIPYCTCTVYYACGVRTIAGTTTAAAGAHRRGFGRRQQQLQSAEHDQQVTHHCVYRVYRKRYNAGTVTLGGNAGLKRHYFVVSHTMLVLQSIDLVILQFLSAFAVYIIGALA
jgi:hypothetical protein